MQHFSNTLILTVVTIFVLCQGTTYFKEEFPKDYTDRWIESTHKGAEQGKFAWSAGKYFNDAEKDKGIQTSQDAKFYGISTKFDSFTNKDKKLVLQFQVKHEQNIDCGGGYAKLMASDIDQKDFHGETPYLIMFGPDICGMSTKKVHVIFNYKNQNHLIKKEIKCKDDELSHLYTLIVNPDNTFEVLIDNESEHKGSLEDDFDMLPPKKIDDPDAKKPDDWVEEEMMDDPEDKKPEDWDKPKTIPDTKATKPDDWDTEMDGEWEPPQIDNPDYKGEWKPKQIKNPKYKGPWVHPQIDNPEYKADPLLYAYDDIGSIGFDLWQVKSGTIFDNVLITDDVDYAKQYGNDNWKATHDAEKKLKDKADEEERKKMEEESKKAEEEEKKKKESEKDEDKAEDEEDDEEKDKEEGDDAKKDEL